MMLGLLAREHVYLEGPPGVAKTMLSEIVVAVSETMWGRVVDFCLRVRL